MADRNNIHETGFDEIMVLKNKFITPKVQFYLFFLSHKTSIHITNTTTVPLIAGKDTKSASSHNE